MISQRDAFFNSLFELAREDRRIIVVTADCGAPALDRWRAELPGQFYNCGIAEQSGLSIAAGLALEGKRPYFYAIAPFATLRCLEQIRVNMAIMRLPVVVVGVGAGLSYEDSGPTHHALEDLAIMRALPGITIWNITDSVMAAGVAILVQEYGQPAYVRLDREAREPIYDRSDRFYSGINQPYGGYSAAASIISTGNMMYDALATAKRTGQPCIDIYRFPINGKRLMEFLSGTDSIITIEEHYLSGGLGSAVLETLADHWSRIPVCRIGIKNDCLYSYEYGGRETIRKDVMSSIVLEKVLGDSL